MFWPAELTRSVRASRRPRMIYQFAGQRTVAPEIAVRICGKRDRRRDAWPGLTTSFDCSIHFRSLLFRSRLSPGNCARDRRVPRLTLARVKLITREFNGRARCRLLLYRSYSFGACDGNASRVVSKEFCVAVSLEAAASFRHERLDLGFMEFA